MTRPTRPQGPLAGTRVLELAGLAPGPFAAGVLSDLGAEVLRIDSPTPGLPVPPPLERGRRSAIVDLKSAAGASVVLRLAAQADVLLEGFRPGVCERLGIGPAECLAANPRLVYTRLTGWGQSGPLASTAGHDIDYLALAGALEPLGPVDAPPLPPLNYVADFGGGSMLAVTGILAALVERATSGQGQVVDAAMVDGVGMFADFARGLRETGLWDGSRSSNPLAGPAPFYRTYACSDGRFVAVGAIEPPFYAALLTGLGLSADDLPAQWDTERWPELASEFARVFGAKPRDEWERVFDGSDACVTPVLSLDEARTHPHAVARGVAVAPRLSRTPGAVQGPAPTTGEHTRDALRDWGFTPSEIVQLEGAGTIRAYD